MEIPTDNETWVIEEGGDIIEKKASSGIESFSHTDMLLYCLWVADYGMRNAGDLETASDVYADFKSQALKAATALNLTLTKKLFSMSVSELENEYFNLFEAVCDEIRDARESA